MKSTNPHASDANPDLQVPNLDHGPGPNPDLQARNPDLREIFGDSPFIQVMRETGENDTRRVEIGTMDYETVEEMISSNGIMVCGKNAFAYGYCFATEDDEGNVWFLHTPKFVNP